MRLPTIAGRYRATSVLYNGVNGRATTICNVTQTTRIIRNKTTMAAAAHKFSFQPVEKARLLADFLTLPPSSRPTMMSKEARKYYWKAFKDKISTTYAVSNLKKALAGWSPKAFHEEAMELYIAMNEGLAEGSKGKLKLVCGPGLYEELTNQIKQFSQIGRMVWKLHNSDTLKPVFMSLRKAQLQSGDGNENANIFQAIYRFDTEQSVAIQDKKGKVVGGSLDTKHPVSEYIVYEVWVRGDVPSEWKIVAKTHPSEFWKPDEDDADSDVGTEKRV